MTHVSPSTQTPSSRTRFTLLEQQRSTEMSELESGQGFRRSPRAVLGVLAAALFPCLTFDTTSSTTEAPDMCNKDNFAFMKYVTQGAVAQRAFFHAMAASHCSLPPSPLSTPLFFAASPPGNGTARSPPSTNSSWRTFARRRRPSGRAPALARRWQHLYVNHTIKRATHGLGLHGGRWLCGV